MQVSFDLQPVQISIQAKEFNLREVIVYNDFLFLYLRALTVYVTSVLEALCHSLYCSLLGCSSFFICAMLALNAVVDVISGRIVAAVFSSGLKTLLLYWCAVIASHSLLFCFYYHS